MTREKFSQELAKLNLTHLERAIAFLWYYRLGQDFEERTPSELAGDLHEEGFPRPNVSRLKIGLSRSNFTTRGRRNESYQIDLRRLSDLNEKYDGFFKVKKVSVAGSIIPDEWIEGTRRYLEQLVHQINGSYEYGFYDGCAAPCRRLMESLIIETYVVSKRSAAIKESGIFYRLDRLIAYITSDDSFNLGRNTPRTMRDVKQLGDTATHDRFYITTKQDVDDIKASFRRMINELLEMAKIKR